MSANPMMTATEVKGADASAVVSAEEESSSNVSEDNPNGPGSEVVIEVDDVLVEAVVLVELDADVVVDVDVVVDEAMLVDVVVVVVLVDVVVLVKVLVDVVVELLVEVYVEVVVDVAVLVVVSVVVGSCRRTITTLEVTPETPVMPDKNRSNRAEASSFVRTSVFT